MLFGDRKRFAIEAHVTESTPSGWVFGRFRFWIHGQEIGDWDDITDLRGCANWLSDFAEKSRLRLESSLDGLSGAEAFRRIHAAAFGDSTIDVDRAVFVPDAFSRFFISHLGMSSFDRFDLLLIKDEVGNERVIWRGGDERIHEMLLAPLEMERIAIDFCASFSEKYQ